MGKTKKSIRGKLGRKSRNAGKGVPRKLMTRKRKLNRKNKKTRRKGVKQTGGRRRPNGPGTGGATASASASASANNGHMNEGGPDDLNEEAIRLIQANNREGLLELLGTRVFPDDEALMEAVTMPGANMEMISEVIFRTYIHGDTEDKISAAMEETPDLLIEVIDALKEQELRQEEAAALAQQEQKYPNHNNGRVSTPPPMNHED
jgi:hypothetical protein